VFRREGTTIDVTEGLATRPDHPTYVLSRWLFLRLLGVVYFYAFVSLVLQITGLVGEHGILPAGEFLERAHSAYGRAAYRQFPTPRPRSSSSSGSAIRRSYYGSSTCWRSSCACRCSMTPRYGEYWRSGSRSPR
jgi:hypothetical protein